MRHSFILNATLLLSPPVAALEKLRAESLTERERLVLEKGISNLEFHYLDSAKILGGVGKGLAEAMAELTKRK